MTGPSCMHAASLMERRASGLSEAERLALEEHVAGCDGCARDSALLQGMARRVAAIEPRLSPQTRARVVDAALAEAAAVQPVGQGAPPRAMALAAAAAVALAVGAGVLWPRDEAAVSGPRDEAAEVAHGQGASPQTGASAVADGAGAEDHRDEPKDDAPPGLAVASSLLGGELVHAGRRIDAGSPLPRDAVLHTERGARLRAGRAELKLSAGGALRLSADLREVELLQGAVVADVEARKRADVEARGPGEPERFAVRTEHFTAVVLGTRFEVTLQGVAVERGVVRVEAPDGRVLAPALRAGERFERSAAPEPQAESTGRRAGRRGPGAPALLQAARRALADGDVEPAQRDIARALAARPSARLRAEAMSLRAEAHLMAGQRAAAVRSYLQVARRFAGSAAGENALFAAARLEAERGAARAPALLSRYLERYPQGRFVREARSRMRALSANSRR